jgi:hypothetical protein
MKPFNKMALFAIAAMTIAGIVGCSKTSNSGTTASTPAQQCVLSNGMMVIAGTNTPCSGTAQCTYVNGAYVYIGTNTPCNTGSMICPSTGYYQGPNGQMIQCIPGQPVNGTMYTGYPGYPGQPYPATNCHQYDGVYHFPDGSPAYYVPAYVQGQLWCVRYDLVTGAFQQSSQPQYYYGSDYYDYGYDYYYAYPPYFDSTNNCANGGTQIDLGLLGQNFGGMGYFCL